MQLEIVILKATKMLLRTMQATATTITHRTNPQTALLTVAS